MKSMAAQVSSSLVSIRFLARGPVSLLVCLPTLPRVDQTREGQVGLSSDAEPMKKPAPQHLWKPGARNGAGCMLPDVEAGASPAKGGRAKRSGWIQPASTSTSVRITARLAFHAATSSLAEDFPF